MFKKYQNSITFRYLTIATVFLIIAQLISSKIQNKRLYNQEADRVAEKIETKADFLSLVTRDAFLRSDRNTLQDLARKVNDNPHLVYSVFVDSNQQIIAYNLNQEMILDRELLNNEDSSDITLDLIAQIKTDKNITEISQSVLLGDRSLGEIRLAYSTITLQRKFQALNLTDFANAILIDILFAALTFIIFNRYILSPLKKIKHLAQELAAGNLEQRINLSRQDELGEIGDALNAMASQFQHTLNNLEKVMDETLVAERAKSQFLGKMSHELKTPLNGIIGFTQIMQQESIATVEQLESLDIIEKNSLHLLNLINDVLEITTIESGKSSLNISKFNLHQLLLSIEQMFSFKAKDKNLNLIFNIDSSVPQYIENDEDKLKQIIINLLNNSLKFTTKGEIALTVKKKADSQEDSNHSIYFKITDTGKGISSQNLDELFVTFAQAENNITTSDGMGLGLPISKQLIQLMGGDISIKSEIDRGTVVRFSIPLTEIDVTDLNFPQSSCFDSDQKSQQIQSSHLFSNRDEVLLSSKLRQVKGTICESSETDSIESQFFVNPGSSYDVTKKKLSTMPQEWLIELQESTIKIDNELIFAVLERIPNQDKDLKQALMDMIENFRYDSILELTDDALNKK